MQKEIILITAITFFTSNSLADSYWLKYATTTLPKGIEPHYIVDTPDRGLDIVVIEIKGKEITINDTVCSSKIVSKNPFTINRALSRQIDSVGGEAKFSKLMREKLKTDFKNWKEEIFTTITKGIDGTGCPLISEKTIYLGKDELIIPYSSEIYRFEKGPHLPTF